MKTVDLRKAFYNCLGETVGKFRLEVCVNLAYVQLNSKDRLRFYCLPHANESSIVLMALVEDGKEQRPYYRLAGCLPDILNVLHSTGVLLSGSVHDCRKSLARAPSKISGRFVPCVL